MEAIGITECKPMATPLPVGLDLSAEGGNVLSNSILYRKLIGTLIHLANTVWIYITYSVEYLMELNKYIASDIDISDGGHRKQ